jgi:hypothetical protein
MVARNVTVNLKPNRAGIFAKQIENETIPTLRKHAGFQGAVTFLAPSGTKAVAISFWDKRENADAYAKSGYPEVLKNLNKLFEGTPTVWTYEVANSTFHKIAATVAA